MKYLVERSHREKPGWHRYSPVDGHEDVDEYEGWRDLCTGSLLDQGMELVYEKTERMLWQ